MRAGVVGRAGTRDGCAPEGRVAVGPAGGEDVPARVGDGASEDLIRHEDLSRQDVRAYAAARGRAHTRPASTQDIPAATAAVRSLLVELGASPPPAAAMRESARALIADPDAGALIVTEVEGELAGVLAASWQLALHCAGRYALIQDLWVDPARRGEGVGRDLIAGLCRRAVELGLARVEVGLPRPDYPGLAATSAFYAANGFTALGVRMRRGLG